MVRRLKLKRGISPVIAVLLLIAIAVAAAIITYAWVSGLLTSLTSTGGGQQVSEQLVMEAYDFTDLTTLTIYVRNTGTVKIEIDKVYYDGTQLTTASLSFESTTLDVNTVKYIVLKLGSAETRGTSHAVKIVTVSGSIFTFNVIAGRAG